MNKADKVVLEAGLVIAFGFTCGVMIVLAVCYADQIDQFMNDLVYSILR